MKFLIGQRVLLNNKEIGIVTKIENNKQIWVHSPSKGFDSCYDVCNVKPLPNGQL